MNNECGGWLALMTVVIAVLGILLVSAVYEMKRKIEDIERHLSQITSDLREMRRPATGQKQ
jgi:uncharacterized protein YoxC